jgi:hypothetical protein
MRRVFLIKLQDGLFLSNNGVATELASEILAFHNRTIAQVVAFRRTGSKVVEAQMSSDYHFESMRDLPDFREVGDFEMDEVAWG